MDSFELLDRVERAKSRIIAYMDSSSANINFKPSTLKNASGDPGTISSIALWNLAENNKIKMDENCLVSLVK